MLLLSDTSCSDRTAKDDTAKAAVERPIETYVHMTSPIHSSVVRVVATGGGGFIPCVMPVDVMRPKYSMLAW
jgi:hypothetical protein